MRSNKKAARDPSDLRQPKTTIAVLIVKLPSCQRGRTFYTGT